MCILEIGADDAAKGLDFELFFLLSVLSLPHSLCLGLSLLLVAHLGGGSKREAVRRTQDTTQDREGALGID